MEHIASDALQRILQEACMRARCDARAILAMLQGCYLEEVIRVSIEEQGPRAVARRGGGVLCHGGAPVTLMLLTSAGSSYAIGSGQLLS